MLDGQALHALVEQEQPRLIAPQIEAISTPALVELESESNDAHAAGRVAAGLMQPFAASGRLNHRYALFSRRMACSSLS